MDFEWDDDKADENTRKHAIDFDEAALVFLDPHRVEKEDTRKDYGEERFQVVGFSAGRILLVVYTERGERIRLISARKATRRERRLYENAFGSQEPEEREDGLGTS